MPRHLHFCAALADPRAGRERAGALRHRAARDWLYTTISANDAMVSTDKNSRSGLVTTSDRSPFTFFIGNPGTNVTPATGRRGRSFAISGKRSPEDPASHSAPDRAANGTRTQDHPSVVEPSLCLTIPSPREGIRRPAAGSPTLRERLPSTFRDGRAAPRGGRSQSARSASPYSPSGPAARSNCCSRWRSWTRRILPEMVLGSSANSSRRTRL